MIIERFIFTYADYLKYCSTYTDGEVEDICVQEESESEENMSTIRERLAKEYINERKQGIALGISEGISRGITRGIKQGIAQTIEKMIKMNFKDEIIKEATGAEETEIKRIRKSCNNQ